MKSIKMEQMVSMDKLPDVLVQLANGLRGQGAQAALLGNLDLAKMKLQVENTNGQAFIKLSIKPARQVSPSTPFQHGQE